MATDAVRRLLPPIPSFESSETIHDAMTVTVTESPNLQNTTQPTAAPTLVPTPVPTPAPTPVPAPPIHTKTRTIVTPAPTTGVPPTPVPTPAATPVPPTRPRHK